MESSAAEAATAAPSAGLAWVLGGTAAVVAVHGIALPFVAPALRKHCLPYVAANAEQIRMLGAACKARRVKKVVDLGSGDGVVCVELSKRLGIETLGYELNPWLVWYARLSARLGGVSHLAKFERADLFRAPVHDADAVALFVVPAMMRDIERKLDAEMRPGAHVFAARFPLETWTPVAHEQSPKATAGYNVNQLWIYDLKDRPPKGGMTPP